MLNQACASIKGSLQAERQGGCRGDRASPNNAHLIYPEDAPHSSAVFFVTCETFSFSFLAADKSQEKKNLNDLRVRLSQQGATCARLFHW